MANPLRELTCTLRHTGYDFEASCLDLDIQCRASNPEVARELLRSLIEAELRSNPGKVDDINPVDVFTLAIDKQETP